MKLPSPCFWLLIEKIELGEHGSDRQFPRARAPEYSAKRGQAYLLSSERVQEFPCRYGRHARFRWSGIEPELLVFCLPEKTPWHFFGLMMKALRPDFARV